METCQNEHTMSGRLLGGVWGDRREVGKLFGGSTHVLGSASWNPESSFLEQSLDSLL